MLHRKVARWMPLVIAAFFVGRAAHAQTGRITGQVTDTAGGRPIAGVEITVVGEGGRAQVGARTDAAGKYTLGTVAPGSVQVRARMLGYAPKDRTVTVTAGQTVTADFALSQRSIQLDQVVVTGTGGAVERRAVGNVIESINANEVLKAAAPRSVEQLIGARTPGVMVLPATGQVGTGAQIRVRSVGSLSLGTDPIVYIDGVRMDANTSQGPAQRGGAGASRLNDINPEDIESIEIIKGPAAATLYGTEASNGVVQIITKRGSNSAPHWDFTTRQGTNWLANPEGRAGLLWSKNATTGQLEPLNLYRYAIDSGAGPVFHNGNNQGYSAQPARRQRHHALLSLVVVRRRRRRRFLELGQEVRRARQHRHRGQQEASNRGKPRLHPRPHPAGAERLDQPGSIQQSRMGPTEPHRRQTGGFGFAPAALWDDVEDHADVDRMTTSVTARYEPFTWFTHRVALGLDVNSENNWTLYPRETAENAGFYGSNGLGAKTVERASRNFLTLDYSGNLKYSLRSYRLHDLDGSAGLSFGAQQHLGERHDLPGVADHDGVRHDDAQRDGRLRCQCDRRSVRAAGGWPGTTVSSSPPRFAVTTTAHSARTTPPRTIPRSADRGSSAKSRCGKKRPASSDACSVTCGCAAHTARPERSPARSTRRVCTRRAPGIRTPRASCRRPLETRNSSQSEARSSSSASRRRSSIGAWTCPTRTSAAM